MLTPEAEGDEGMRTDDEGTPSGCTTGIVPSVCLWLETIEWVRVSGITLYQRRVNIHLQREHSVTGMNEPENWSHAARIGCQPRNGKHWTSCTWHHSTQHSCSHNSTSQH